MDAVSSGVENSCIRASISSGVLALQPCRAADARAAVRQITRVSFFGFVHFMLFSSLCGPYGSVYSNRRGVDLMSTVYYRIIPAGNGNLQRFP